MNDEEEDFENILIDFEQKFTMIRIVDNMFVPSDIAIKVQVMPVEDSTDQDYEIAFAKIRFWFENVVSRCVAFGKSNKVALKMLIDEEGRNLSGNLLMLTPDEPSDENLAILMQAKMAALADGKLMFGSVEIKSNNLTGLRFTFVGSCLDLLPSMEDWIGTHSYFKEPWWLRDDASTLDVIPPEDADLTQKPAWAYTFDFIEKAFRPTQDVLFNREFKPTVIDGGKTDE